MSQDLKGRVGLSPYYLNTRRLEALSAMDIPVAAQSSLNENNSDRVAAMGYARNIAKTLLQTGKIPNLSRVGVEHPEGERILATTYGAFTFKGSRKAFETPSRGKAGTPATFTGTLLLGEREIPAFGELVNDHFYSQSSIGMLSGKRNLFIMGQFEFSADRVEIFPYVIGDLIDDLSPFLNMSIRSSLRVYPEQIDSFGPLRDAPAATAGDLKALQAMSEASVKDAIAAIIGELFVPADWGGEVSDLQTNHIVIDGKPAAAAFILKGPALKGEMHPNNMGSRGDQLVRAFGEPVELVVVQHCRKIANTVVKTAEAMAIDPRDPKRFCILDGSDTARLLKLHGKL